MKNILVLTVSLLSLSAYGSDSASKLPADYKFFSASFGSDGASKEPYPNPNSTTDARTLYKAMTTPNSSGEKFIGLTIEGERYGLNCQEPKKGITAYSAGCEFTGLSKKRGFQETEHGINIDGDVKFGGKLAKMLVENMSLEKDSTRIGSVNYTLANLACTQTVGLGFVECTLGHTVVKSMDFDSLVDEGMTTKAKAKKIVEKLGY